VRLRAAHDEPRRFFVELSIGSIPLSVFQTLGTSNVFSTFNPYRIPKSLKIFRGFSLAAKLRFSNWADREQS